MTHPYPFMTHYPLTSMSEGSNEPTSNNGQSPIPTQQNGLYSHDHMPQPTGLEGAGQNGSAQNITGPNITGPANITTNIPAAPPAGHNTPHTTADTLCPDRTTPPDTAHFNAEAPHPPLQTTNTPEQSDISPQGQGQGQNQGQASAQHRPATPHVPSGEVALPANALSIPKILAWHSIPAELIHAMAGGSLATGLERVINFAPLPLRPGIPLALGGASGSGKSLTLAKLAARYARQARQSGGRIRQPLVLACDSTPGSYIKLASILRGCDLELVKAYGGLSPAQIDGYNRIILVDLPGLCVYSPSAMTEMQEVIERTRAMLSLVIPAGMDPEESTDIAAAFQQCGADSLIASRMEQSGRIGSIITAAACGLSLTYGSYSGSINEGFTQLTPAILARRLLVLPG